MTFKKGFKGDGQICSRKGHKAAENWESDCNKETKPSNYKPNERSKDTKLDLKCCFCQKTGLTERSFSKKQNDIKEKYKHRERSNDTKLDPKRSCCQNTGLTEHSFSKKQDDIKKKYKSKERSKDTKLDLKCSYGQKTGLIDHSFSRKHDDINKRHKSKERSKDTKLDLKFSYGQNTVSQGNMMILKSGISQRKEARILSSIRTALTIVRKQDWQKIVSQRNRMIWRREIMLTSG
jgi:hypothetical protein